MHNPSPLRRALTRATILTATATAVAVAVPAAAFADTGGDVVYLAAKDLPGVISSIQTWVLGILGAIVTLFIVYGGVLWATAGGDPSQVERAKGAFRNALVGFAIAILAPVFLQVVKGFVGG
ncbi:pilin [Longispora albida]|uniref:pilin n=1 Tax=Longispora albida TaxID=203523 RepID=UPI0003713482|nr:pilin [Longispora albida]